jgi:hypothetical protein
MDNPGIGVLSRCNHRASGLLPPGERHWQTSGARAMQLYDDARAPDILQMDDAVVSRASSSGVALVGCCVAERSVA